VYDIAGDAVPVEVELAGAQVEEDEARGVRALLAVEHFQKKGAARRPCGHTWTSCCPTCLRVASSPAACSTGIGLDGVPHGYGAMADREAIKIMVTP